MPIANLEERRAYNRQWIRSRREAWFNENGPCVRCGSNEQLELDHIDPALKISHQIWSWSAPRRMAELSKCQILCHNCHLNKTRTDRKRNIKHGMDATYTRQACRCDECRLAHKISHRIDYIKSKQKKVDHLPSVTNTDSIC